MRLSKRVAPLIAVAGAAIAVIPAVASSDAGPTVNGLDTAVWSPARVTVDTGASVNFVNSSGIPHGVVWNGGPATPSCNGVPLGQNFSASWSGSCAFTEPGTYTYYCSYHGPSMSGEVIVNAAGTPTTSTPTTTTSPPGTTTDGPTPTGGSATPSTLGAVSLSTLQQGVSVHGSAKLGHAKSRLEVDLATVTASLASDATKRRTNAGRLIKRSAGPGKVKFSARLSAKAKHALQRRGHLALKVTIIVTPPGGVAVSATRHVTLHSS